jgi:hypothetical protein
LTKDGDYSIAAIVPSKDGNNTLAFTYETNAKQKTVKPMDETGNAAMTALIEASASKKQPARPGARATEQDRPAAKRSRAAAKPQTRKPAAKKPARAQEE